MKMWAVVAALVLIVSGLALKLAGGEPNSAPRPAGTSSAYRDAGGVLLPVGVEPPRSLTFHGMTLYIESPWQVMTTRDKASHDVLLRACPGDASCSELLLSSHLDASNYHCVSRHRPCKGALSAGSGHLAEYSEVLLRGGPSKVYRLWMMGGGVSMLASGTDQKSVDRMFASIEWSSGG
jgi:hypothetical protein